MNTQNLFDYAEQRYKHARNLIAEMTKLVQENQPSFKERSAYCQFDIMVQFILLNIALADGKFSEIEGEFIDEITESYDVLFLFDSDDDTDYDWSFVGAYMTLEHAEYLVNTVKKRAIEHIQSFICVFAEAELLDNGRKYFDELFKCIKDIASAFIMCDGNATKKEIELAVNVVRQYFTNPWLTQQNKLKNPR